MIRIYRIILLCVLAVCSETINAQVTGTVIDSRSREALDYVNVYYEGKNCGVMTDEDGRFIIKEDSTWNELTVQSMGYTTQKIKLVPGRKQNLKIRLVPESTHLEGVTVTANKKRYSRKNNPAVDLMRKVIEKKRNFDIHSRDYYTFTKYEKMTFSLNEFTDRVLEEGEFKKLAFLKDHVERCPQTGKLILPLTVDETVSQIFYRKDPHSEKALIKGQSNKGVTELINTGEIITTMLKDVFTDVDIYENECRLLQFPFKSPIANSAIGFYRYYLQDTIFIENDKVIDVGFLPNNQQDFGFSGHLYILADSSYQVRRVELTIPRRSDVNFVENMIITQDYEELPTGERVITNNDMLVEMKLTSWLNKLQVQRTIRNNEYTFQEIPNRVFKHIKGSVYKEPDAEMQNADFWGQYRTVELTKSESGMDSFMDKLTHIKGFKYIIFGVKALIENFVETGKSTDKNYVDIGPINTIISTNHYDKFRLRASALTNANLCPHFFASGYVAYGFNTHNVYGKAELTYSFNKKAYLPREFPQNNLSVSYQNDIVSPFDKFIPTDKDNVFTALKASSVDQYNHTSEFKLSYVKEWENGCKLTAGYTNTRNKPVDALFYQRLGTGSFDSEGLPVPDNDPSKWLRTMQTSEFKFGVSFEPGATYINTKQRRIKINHDAPIISLSHTAGFNGFLGGQYNYNVTEAGLYKRFWVPGAWGKMDTDIKAGIQWNVVPFPLLIHPAANQSYILEDYTFSLISNLEFLNDRYLTCMWEWDLNGKLLNRIPLIKKLKWRELIGVNLLWGDLTDKNDPFKSNNHDIFYFPGHFKQIDGKEVYECNTQVMNTKVPYVELRLGIHNIFKILHIEYVRRLTYLHNPGTNTWGIRGMVRMTF